MKMTRLVSSSTRQTGAAYDVRQIRAYRSWLANQARSERAGDLEQDVQRYQQQASQTRHIGHQEICTFALFRPALSAWQTFTRPQLLTGVFLTAAWLIALFIWHWTTLAWTVGAITCLYALTLSISCLIAFSAVRAPAVEHIDDSIVDELDGVDWPLYTILCPLYKEAVIIPQFVQAMRALNYPTDRLQVLFLVETDDAETRNALLTLSLPAHFQVITVPSGSPRTKPRACNYGLMHARGRYVVIYDAEDIPDPLQLKKAVLTFAQCDNDVVCVQARLNCYNPTQNLLTRWYTELTFGS